MRVLPAALLLLFAGAAHAERFDLAQFTVPPGFTAKETGGQLVLSRVEADRGAYVMIAFFPSRPDARAFAEEWRATAGTELGVNEVPTATPATTPSGAPFAEGGVATTLNGTPAYAHLLVFSVEGRTQSILVVASSLEELLRPGSAIPGFLHGLRLGQDTPTRPLWKGAPIVGIWMGFKNTGSVEYDALRGGLRFDLTKAKLRWRTFLADGSSFEGLPSSGLLASDVEVARRDPSSGAFWGTWTLRDGKVTARQPSGRVQEYHLDGDELREDGQTTGHATYWRVRPLDGMKLDGRWSSLLNWDEAQAGPSWITRPLISFTTDGRFIDEGAFAASPIRPPAPDARPGRGTYAIEGFTLILRYDDGRVVHRTFCAPPASSAKDSPVVFIGQFSFHRT